MALALRKVKGNIERLFDKSLTDLVRGIRNNRDNEARYIAQCIDEIKQELKQDNIAVKTNAIEKLAYLQMLGYDISWAAFNIIEVMSSPRFTCKRVGYLAASQTFSEDTDVLMLTTNMIRKDITSPNLYDASIALGALSCFISTDLARDLANDAMSLMSSSKYYIRKRAVLLLYKVFLKYPDALRPCFARLKEKLEDPDPGVQSAAVNVICELARKHPKNYLALAPTFFKLMTNSTNNWMLIKIIKLFGALTPLEPRLGKKLIEPLTTLIHSTSAMSLLYECINTVIAVLLSVASALPDHTSSIQLCVQKLRILIEDSDQNLKYLGLLAMSKILQAHPKSVLSLKDLILQCLDDRDESIRLRALDLLYGMVNKKTLVDIVKKLMDHMEKAEGSGYRDELLSKIIHICSQNNYQYIVDFEWYVSVLVDLTKMEGIHHGSQIAAQLLDVAVRVSSVRHFIVQQMALLLENAHRLPLNAHGSTVHEVLLAAAWICGEFSEHLIDPRDTMEAMLKSKVTHFPAHIQAVYVQNIGKLYSKVITKAEAEDDSEIISAVGQLLLDRLNIFVGSSELEVQERASALLQVVQTSLALQQSGSRVAGAVQALYAGELNPVAPQAQKKVPVPEGLNLEAWINEPAVEKTRSGEDDEEEGQSPRFKKVRRKTPKNKGAFGVQSEEVPEEGEGVEYPSLTEKETAELRERRLMEQASNPYYIKPATKPASRPTSSLFSSPETPKTATAAGDGTIPGLTSSDRYLRQQKKERNEEVKRKSKKSSKKRSGATVSDDEGGVTAHVVNRDMGEMPEGATLSDAGSDHDDPYRALNIDIQSPLRPEERLPVGAHRAVQLKTGGAEPVRSQPDTASKKEKRSRTTKEEKDEKKKKKSSKSTEDGGEVKEKKKKRKEEAGEPSLISIDDTLAAVAGEKDKVKEETIPLKAEEVTKKNINAADDLSFWLSSNEEVANLKKAENGESTNQSSATKNAKTEKERPKSLNVKPLSEKEVKKTLKKDEKDGKKKKKSTRDKLRSHSVEEELIDEAPEVVDKTGYEEAFGVELEEPTTTGSSPMTESGSVSRFVTLLEDQNIKVEYDTYVYDAASRQIALNIVFASKLSEGVLRNIAFEVVDSVGMSVDQSQLGAEMPVKHSMLSAKASWNVTLVLNLKSTSAAAQTLRGSLTYLTGSGTAKQEVRDFKLALPASAFLLPVQISVDEFSMLLECGELNSSGDLSVEVGMGFEEVLSKIGFQGRFFLVEQVASSATLHAMSVLQQRVALMVKFTAGSGGKNKLVMTAKSADGALTGPLLEEIAASFKKATA
ncbi:hypothetical protein RvY_16114 [Ramazzottius varieornatus]|uniref:AP-3 complex subunit delta n=1 Tax=Ramazzottius varieornatus TaxID=947166 RepID=A0A1D1W529_RAMVA|nr:hypothetical protein RvY_16114 [Ramazzottius varieornatus]